MIAILDYIFLNSRLLVFSLFGLTAVFLILKRISGARYNNLRSMLLWMIFWSIRFFGLSLYLSTYLAGKYSEESWFQWVFIIASLFNILLGVLMISVTIDGDLRKNILIWLLLEVVISAAGLFPVVLMWGDTHIMGKPLNPNNPKELFIFFYFPLLFFAILKLLDRTEEWIGRLRKWQPRHKHILDLVIVVFFIQGFFSNIWFYLTRGNVAMLWFSILAVIFLCLLWFLFLKEEQKKALDDNRDMVRQEAVLKKYYEQVNAQSAKIQRFNSEIQHSLEALMETLSEREEATAEEKEAENHLRSLAQDYRQKLEDHYREITLSKYSRDPAVNDLLTSYEERYRDLNVSVLYSFHRYQKPAGRQSEDVERLLRFLLDEGAAQYSSLQMMTPVAGSETLNMNQEQKHLFLQGGMAGGRLIISCEYQGLPLSKKQKKQFRQLLRQIQADGTITQKDDTVKIIVELE